MPMDHRELSVQVGLLSAAVEKQQEPAKIIEILKKLSEDFIPTEADLRSTKVGVHVGKLRHHKDKDVVQLAGVLVTKWKNAVGTTKKKKTSSMNGASSSSGISAASSQLPLPSAPYVGDISKRRWETDKVDLNRTGDDRRDKCIGMIYNGLAFNSTETPSAIIMKAIEIESAAFEQYKTEKGDLTPAYSKQLRMLFLNLKHLSNPDLGPNVMAGEITAQRFVTMNEMDVKSDVQLLRDEALARENMKNAQVPMPEKSISDALQCGRCKQKKVSYSQAQTRSADEPMTTFCTCTNCGHRWKFS